MVSNPKSLDEYLPIEKGRWYLISAFVLLFACACLGARTLQSAAAKIGGKAGFWSAFFVTLWFICMLVVAGARSRPFRWLGAYWQRNIIAFTACFDRRGELHVLSNREMRGLRSILPQSDGETIYADLKGKTRDPFSHSREGWLTSFGGCSDGRIDSVDILVHCRGSTLRMRPEEVFAWYDGSPSAWSLDSRASDLLKKEIKGKSMTEAYLKTHREWSELGELFATSLQLHLQTIRMLKEMKRLEKSKSAAMIRQHLGSNLITLLPRTDPAYDDLVREYGGKVRA